MVFHRDRRALLLWGLKSSKVKVNAKTAIVHITAHFTNTLIGDADDFGSDPIEKDCADGLRPWPSFE